MSSKQRFMAVLVAVPLMAFIFAGPAYPVDTILTLGGHIGLTPAMGGEMGSRFQETVLNVSNGIEGISRSKSGVKTEKIDRLLGAYGGIDFKAIFIKYLMIRIQANFAMNFYGGTGVSLDALENRMKVSYSMWAVDLPFTLGFSVPFGDEARISLCAGLAFAYGSYSNSFKSAAVNSSAEFTGWAFPWVIALTGEYFFRKDIAISSSIAYYRGATDVLKSGSDYAKIDFTGFRWNVGFSYYFRGKEKQEP